MAKSTDHDLIEWVKVEELLNRKLAPADVFIAQQLLDEYWLQLFSQNTKFNLTDSLDSVQSIDRYYAIRPLL